MTELPTLPSQTKAFNRLDAQYLETKKGGMEQYLRTISSQEFLNTHTHVFHKLFLFLTGPSYTRQSTEIARTVRYPGSNIAIIYVLVCVLNTGGQTRTTSTTYKE